MPPFQPRLRPPVTFASQECSGKAGLRSPADLERLRPGSIYQELQAARTLAERYAYGAFDLISIEPQNTPCCYSGSKDAAGGRGMEATCVVLACRQSQADPAGRFVSGNDPCHEIGTGGADQSCSR